ncbi:MAG TPA: M42 family peptidase [Clostridia bacterium]|nr:M42 family peptidase [Clostridia bacterium]
MRMETLLREMALIPALAGAEQKMAAYMEKRFKEIGYETTIDTFGNCIAKVGGTDPKAPTVMVFGHMDQLGFMVRRIDPDGFLRLERLGGIPEKVLPATPVQIQTENGEMIDGIIGVKSHHVTPAEEKYKVDTYMNLYIDIGATSREQVVALGIEIGAPVVYKPNFVKLQGTRAYGTSFDNRVACAIIMDMAYRLKENPPEANVYLVGSVQEEYNLRGAMMAARTIKPDIAIALDVNIDGQTPDMVGKNDVVMGNGPVMSMYNFHGRGTLNGTIPHPGMVKLVKRVAEREKINLQRSASIGGLTDLAYVQLEGTGVVGIDIGTPARYTHSPVELCDIKDVELTSDLVMAVVYAIKAGAKFER